MLLGGCSEAVSRRLVEPEAGVRLPSPTHMIERNITVPENTNIIINDTGNSTKSIEGNFRGLNSAKVDFIILDTYELTYPLQISLINFLSEIDIRRAAILFPGKGSESVKVTLSKETKNLISKSGISANTNTQREYVSCGRFVRPVLTNPGIPKKLVNRIIDNTIENVVVIDDVVSTGQTIQGMRLATETMVRDKLPEDSRYDPYVRFSYPNSQTIPKISFSTFTWLLQKSACVEGYTMFPTSIYERRSGKVPVNSLSTFLYDKIKGEKVASLYAEKYFSDPYEFKSLLEKLIK